MRISKRRKGSHSPGFLEPRRITEQASMVAIRPALERVVSAADEAAWLNALRGLQGVRADMGVMAKAV